MVFAPTLLRLEISWHKLKRLLTSFFLGRFDEVKNEIVKNYANGEISKAEILGIVDEIARELIRKREVEREIQRALKFK